MTDKCVKNQATAVQVANGCFTDLLVPHGLTGFDTEATCYGICKPAHFFMKYTWEMIACH